ncbi:sensor histidine kinase [Paenibacillaceae bacterium]|nr:sensor histidine kinase [Paenibacillaceae bacterium]
MGYTSMKALNHLSLKNQALLFVLIFFVILILSYVIPFNIYKSTMEERTSYASNRMMIQIKDNISGFYSDMDGIASSLVYGPTVQRYMATDNRLAQMDMEEELRRVFVNTIIMKSNIKGIQLYDKQGMLTAKIGEGPVETAISQSLDHTEYSGVMEGTNAVGPSSLHHYYMIYVPVFSTENIGTFREQLGTCILIMDTRNYSNIVTALRITPNSRFFLLDKSRKVIADDSGKADVSDDLKIVKSKSDDYLLQELPLDASGWTLVSAIPKHELWKDLNTIKRITAAVDIIAIILLVLAMSFFSSSVLRPIKSIIDFMKSISRGGINKRYEITYNNEIGVLATSMNNMLDEIDRLGLEIHIERERLYQLELVRKQTEISALQSQINPHFLYNTLECVRAIAISYKAKEIIDISAAMSGLFHYSIKAEDFVDIREEVRCIEQYLNIVHIRFAGRIQAKLDIDERIVRDKTLKMIVQPIVENAVFHGLEQKIEGGLLHIRMYPDKANNIHYEVRDNGVGIEKKRLDSLRDNFQNGDLLTFNSAGSQPGRTSIGLKNVYHRLKLFYGAAATMAIDSMPGEGTSVHIVFPKTKQ